MGVAFGCTHSTLKDHIVCLYPLRNSDNAGKRAAITDKEIVPTCHLVDRVGRRIDGTRETSATIAIANYLNTPGGHHVPEWRSRF